MTTLLYGSIIQIRSTESIYENKFFFVNRLDDDVLVLKSNDGNIVEIQIEDGSLGASITEIVVVYKPTKGYCEQNRLYPLQWVEVEFEDQTVKGQIIRADTIIEIKLKDESIYIPVDRGLPKDVLIRRISKPVALENSEEIEMEEIAESPEEDEVLGYIEEEDDEINVQYFYSIEQQTTDLLEHLLLNIAEEDRTPKLMKKMFKTIQRYKELRSKYTDFKDGIHIHKLARDQIYDGILKMKNKYFLPITRDIEVNHYNPDEEYLKASFFRNAPEDWVEVISDKINKSTKFEDKRKAFDDFTENYVYHTKTNTRRLNFTPTESSEIYLYDIPSLITTNRYNVRTQHPVLIHSLMTPPSDYLLYSRIYDLGSSILQKSNLNQTQYYSFLYKGKQQIVKESDLADLFLDNKYVYYENQSEIYDNYVKKLTPSLKNWIELGLNSEFITPFYNFYQSTKELETVQMSEFHSADYLIVEAFIKMAVKNFTKIKIDAGQHKDYKFVEQAVSSRLSDLYKELMPKDLQVTYFSSSELFKIGEIDQFNYYKSNYVKDQSVLDITDEEIKSMLEEIRAKATDQVEEKISKIYKTEEERMADRRNVILKDINRISGLEYIYQKLIEKKRKVSLEKLKIMIDTIIANGLKPTKRMPEDLSAEVLQYISEIRILEGELAYVEDSKKKYAWNGLSWEDVNTNPTCFIKKKLFKGTCETIEKETEYNEKILRIIKEIEQEKKRQTELKGVNSELTVSKTKAILFSLNSKKLKHDLKYNEEKRIYSVLESSKDVSVNPDSPYKSLKDKILSETDITFKFKAIQIFIQKYTKQGSDPYWYYCIETGSKLLPTFFHKLADAYLITQNYEKVVEKICLDQGTLSDNGDKWVDKYSGYIIQNINFDEDTFGREMVLQEEDKPIFDDVLLEELESEREISLSLKSLFFYLGVIVEDHNLYPLIMKSYKAAIPSGAEESQKKQIRLYSIMSHALIYIQTHDLKKGKPFPNCRASFDGYPLTDITNIKGIKYMVCVVSKLSKATVPWNILSKTSEEQISTFIAAFLNKYVVPMIEIEEALVKKRIGFKEEKVHFQTEWNRFSPRLKPIIPITYNEKGLVSFSDYLYRIYFLSYYIQAIIHKHVSEQSLLLIDNGSAPFMVNACCDKENNVYKYFYEKTKISQPIKEIDELKRRIDVFEYLLLGTKLYFIENTKVVISEPSSEMDEKTIYSGLIKWTTTKKEIFEKFDFPLPKFTNQDSFERKMAKMKEQGIQVNQDTFLSMLQQSATIYPRVLPKEEELLIADHIVDMLDKPDVLNNYLDKKIKEMISKISKKDKSLIRVLNFNNTFKSIKNNLIIPSELEHYSHMNQILYNKINSLIHIFPEMVNSGKNDLGKIVCKHWKLSNPHEEDIKGMVQKYYSNLLSITNDDKLKVALNDVPLDRYVGLMKISMTDQETLNLLYHYIFVHVLYDYKESKSVAIQQYIKTISELFENEDRALNYDLPSIEYSVNFSKKSETQLKTDYFKNLSLEDRKSENVLKEHRLDKWGVGLQKGMFQYVKENYLKDKISAQAVMDNMGDEPEEEVEMEIQEEGYDIDEKAEDDDDDEEYDEDE